MRKFNKKTKKYLVVYDRWCGNKYMGEFVSEENEKELMSSIKSKFSKKYWSEMKISRIYEIKEDVTLEKVEQANKEMKYCRDEKKIKETLLKAKYGW